jgi:hypothetical protein
MNYPLEATREDLETLGAEYIIQGPVKVKDRITQMEYMVIKIPKEEPRMIILWKKSIEEIIFKRHLEI